MFVLSVTSLIFFLFFWLMPILWRFVSMDFSMIVLEPTMKFSCSDVHAGFLSFRRICMKFSYCLDSMFSFISRYDLICLVFRGSCVFLHE